MQVAECYYAWEKLRIQTLGEQSPGGKAIAAAYPTK